MEQKFFMHRIQKENGVISKGIEVHDTKDDAVRAFWGRMKTGYNDPNHPGMTFVHCMITDINGAKLAPYDMAWLRPGETLDQYFMHHIQLDGETYRKDIDVCETFDAARCSYAAQMEYGYNNPRFPNVSLISCMITDAGGAIMKPFDETWRIPDPEPEPPEPDPEPEE